MACDIDFSSSVRTNDEELPPPDWPYLEACK
jgi:hypothetical protein